MKNLFYITGLIILVLIEGCSGCSRSGREKIARENSIASLERENKTHEDAPEKETTFKSNSDNQELSKQYEVNKKGVVTVYSVNGKKVGAQGSGFFISDNGLCVSNHHVFAGFRDHYIKTSAGDVYEVDKVIKYSPKEKMDYVIFRIRNKGQHFFPLKVASTPPKTGESVYTIGNPLGLEHTLTTGIISAIRNELGRIQISAEITYGSSGGPLFNNNGEVIGITSSGLGQANLNFAVDIRSLQLEKYLD